MESLITEEVTELVKDLGRTSGTAISTRHLFNVAIMNVLWRIITGEKYQHDDSAMVQLAETLNRSFLCNSVSEKKIKVLINFPSKSLL